jgi:hypothetical protein
MKSRFIRNLLLGASLFALAGCQEETSSSLSSLLSGSASSVQTPSFYAPIGQVMKWFSDGVDGETKKYNYCPSVFVENNKKYVYFCANPEEGNVTDNICFREGNFSSSSGWSWSDPSYVVAPTASAWDYRHDCDPSAVKGVFVYGGVTYSYLLAFLGSQRSDNNGNEIGFAVSKTPEGPWIKCDTINPLIPYDRDLDLWGTGQASLVSVDGVSDIAVFYSVGAKSGTYEKIREYDFSNLDAPKMLAEQRVPTNGLLSGDYTINDADFAYDEGRKKLLMVKGKLPYSPDGQSPAFIASELVLYSMDCSDKTRWIDEVLSGNNANNWRWITTLGEKETGFKRNHNSGLVTDPYGHLIQADQIEVALTKSDLSDSFWTYLSSYRIYSYSVALS